VKAQQSMFSVEADPGADWRYVATRQLIGIALLAAGFSASGHGGEDHGAPPPAVTQSMPPRAVAATEEFEVVAVLEDNKLIVYVDRFSSNAPVIKAKVELEGAGLKGIAGETSPGVYVMDVATAIPPARHPLTITVEAGDTADLLSATLDTSQSVVGEKHVHGWSEWIVWAIAGLLLLASGVLLVAWRNRNSKGF